MKWPVILLNESGSYPSSSLTDSISRSQVPDPRADNTLSFLVELLHWIFFFLSVSPSVMSGSVWSRGLWPARVLCPWDSPGKDTGVGCHFLLQMIFLTQGSNPGLLHHRWTLSPSEPPGKDTSYHPSRFYCTAHSVGKESTCNAGDSSLISGSGRSTGEGIGYPFQYSWASLVAQLVKNLPAMPETWFQSLGWEYPLEKGKATHSSILAWRIPGTVTHLV